MPEYKYVILGAGPSGLAFAHQLLQLGEGSFVLLESNPTAGGLCRSEDVDGAPVDIGGGHFLDVKRTEVLEMLFRFMPRSEWREFARASTIRLRGREIAYPLEANLWRLPVDDQVEYLESIARAGCVRGEPMPESFEDWITWKLGERIAKEYMLPYNRKIWSIDLDDLGTYWLHKLPDVSFKDTLRSCLEGRARGSVPAHGVFLYPEKHGYGEVWRRMGDALGDRLLTSTPVASIDLGKRLVNGELSAEKIVNTIPWTMWSRICELPHAVTEEIGKLRHSSIDVDYREQTLPTRAHWIYDPDEKVPYHRVLCRSNFCAGAGGHWTETNSTRAAAATGWRHHNEYAYPLNTRDKPRVIEKILEWAAVNSIVALGRWGTWEHMNSDVAVSQAIEAANRLCGDSGPE